MASLRNSKSNQQQTPLQGCLLTFVPSILALVLGILAIIFFGGISFKTPPGNSNLAAVQPKRAAGSTKVAALFAPSVQHWSGSVEKWSKEYGIDPNLIATVMQIESCGDPHALSSAGAAGLFQVMPFHFEYGEDPRDPGTNAYRGLSYLKKSLEASGGDVRRALAGYNGGIGVVDQPEAYWPSETQRYVDWGSRIYQEAVQGAQESTALEEWLNSGGSRLCNQASQKLMLFQSQN